MKSLAKKIVSVMPELTVRRSAALALGNARLNLPYIDRTIADLPLALSKTDNDSAIVIAAGPSLHRKDPAPQIKKSHYRGEVVCTDGGLGYCLRNGVIPEYVVTLDPHPTRICRWFGDPDFDLQQNGDDYFRRQDLDPHLNTDEQKRNGELVDLVNQHGPRIRAAICTSVSPRVARRCLQAGMQLYWWNPILDNFEKQDSMTRKLYRSNGVPCMVSGGNSGTAAWVLGHTVLSKHEVVLVGMDLSYPPGTPLEKTQYYKELQELFGERVSDAFIKVYNPYLKETWYADPAYYWYRQSLLQMARQAACVTYNCTEGGTVFGKGIKFISLKDFLIRSSRAMSET